MLESPSGQPLSYARCPGDCGRMRLVIVRRDRAWLRTHDRRPPDVKAGKAGPKLGRCSGSGSDVPLSASHVL